MKKNAFIKLPINVERKLIISCKLPVIAVFLLSACTGDIPGERPETGTPIVLGEINIGSSTPSTRVDITEQSPGWQNGDILTVIAPDGKNAIYRYFNTNWTNSLGNILYLEDYHPAANFTAGYSKAPSDMFPYTNQSTREEYLAQTRIGGTLNLTRRELGGTLTHQNVDLIITITEGRGWTGTQFAEAIASFKYLTNDGEEVTPFKQNATFRAQLSEDKVPAPDERLFTVNNVKGTYTLNNGGTLTNGKRLDIEIIYHASGELAVTRATVAEFIDTNLSGIPAEIVPGGYHYAVYNWENLKEVLSKVKNGENIIQMVDITRPDSEAWTTKDLPENCLYNGNEHTITGLDAPLFKKVNGNVYNLHLKDCDVTATSNDTGLLACENEGTITLCSATGTLKITLSSSQLVRFGGGLVSYNLGSITRSHTKCEILAESSYVWTTAGGLVGQNAGKIVACAAYGTVKATGPNITTGNLVGTIKDAFGLEHEVHYSYATATGNAIGNGSTIITQDDVTVYTLVSEPASATGVSREERIFNKNVDNWWTDTPDYNIDFTYEGKKKL